MTQPLRQRLIDDDGLARLVTAGDSSAFSVIYERYRGPLYRYCRAVLRSDADAHDAVQSTFTRALEALRRDQRDAPLRPWLFRIAHNEAISSIRRGKVSDLLTAQSERQGISAEDASAAREEFRLLLADLRQLPERPRGAILMRELSGLSHDEIADALGTTSSGVKQAIFEARRALADFARGRQMDCLEVRHAIAEGGRRALRSRRIRAHLRDCAECARFAAERFGRSWPLRALTAPAWAGALGNLLSHRLPLGWGTAATDPKFVTGVLGGAAGKVSTVLASGAAIVTAVLTTTGASIVGATYDGSKPTSAAATPVTLGSTMMVPPTAGLPAEGVSALIARHAAGSALAAIIPLTPSPLLLTTPDRATRSFGSGGSEQRVKAASRAGQQPNPSPVSHPSTTDHPAVGSTTDHPAVGLTALDARSATRQPAAPQGSVAPGPGNRTHGSPAASAPGRANGSATGPGYRQHTGAGRSGSAPDGVGAARSGNNTSAQHGGRARSNRAAPSTGAPTPSSTGAPTPSASTPARTAPVSARPPSAPAAALPGQATKPQSAVGPPRSGAPATHGGDGAAPGMSHRGGAADHTAP